MIGWADIACLGTVLAAGALGCTSTNECTTSHCSSPLDTSACATRRQYVTTDFVLPPSAQAATSPMYALKLDGDSVLRYDNKMGAELAGLSSFFGLDFQGVINQAFKNGRDIFLWQFYGSGNLNPNESPDAIQAFLGTPARTSTGMSGPDGGMAPDGGCSLFNGMAEFGIASDLTANFFPGATSSGVFYGGQGGDVLRIHLPLFPELPPLTLNFYGARVTGEVSANGITQGVLGGGVKVADVIQTIIPAFAARLNDIVAQEGGGSACTLNPQSGACFILTTYDGDCAVSSAACPYSGTSNCECDVDGVISAQELIQNVAIQVMVRPDLDLFDGCAGRDASTVSITDPCVDTGNYDPLTDGVKDSISFGIAFTATTARIDGAP